MRLSIITVNLNNKSGLQKTIDSVVSQTFKDFEWIVIDGGSTDGSKELIEQYVDHFSYWVSEPDKGIYNAMNKGIKVAKGEYLQFLNSGDWLCDETALERCFSHGFTADIAYGDIFFCDGKDRNEYHYPQYLSFRLLYKASIGHPASFIKKDVLQNVLYDEGLKIVSDWKFFVIQALRNGSFEYIGETVSCFDIKGISSLNKELESMERAKVIQQYVPNAILADYKYMDEMEFLLNSYHVRKVLEYGSKGKLYHKLITVCLMFIGFIDNIFTRRTN